MTTWAVTVDVDKRMALTNKVMRAHWAEGVMTQIRNDFHMAAFESGNRGPRYHVPVTIEVTSTWIGKLPDVDAAYLASKAAVDGLRDAKVIEDDTGTFIYWVRHHRPTLGDRNAITLTLATLEGP